LELEFPDDEVEVWCQDEARLGLQPVFRRLWCKRGKRPTAQVEPVYEWLWVYGAVHPRSGQVFWLILPYLDGACVQLFLDEFARMHCGDGKRIVLVWDGAPAHRAQKLKKPERMTIINFPAYTPELNPSERLWPQVKEPIVNDSQKNLAELEAKVVARCRKLSENQEAIKSLTSYHWWNHP